jgi:hypothetical protein
LVAPIVTSSRRECNVRVYLGGLHSKVREREGGGSTFRRSHDTAPKSPDRCHGFFAAVYSGCDGTHLVSLTVGASNARSGLVAFTLPIWEVVMGSLGVDHHNYQGRLVFPVGAAMYVWMTAVMAPASIIVPGSQSRFQLPIFSLTQSPKTAKRE